MRLRDYGIGVFVGALGGAAFLALLRDNAEPKLLAAVRAAPWKEWQTTYGPTWKALPADYWWFR